jgi:hypothetical protein
MKKILLLSTILAGSLFISKSASAQFHVNVNIGMQPAWGPSGYDYAEYYYLPDVEAYYSVPGQQFVYFDRGNWISSASLPGRCGNYDLYSGYKVVINERDPWCHFNNHRVQYAPYRFRHDQVVIRDRRGGYGGYGRGGYYGRPGFDERGRGRDWGYDNRNNDNDRRYGRNHDRDDDRGDWNDNNGRHGSNHDDDHGGRGRGRW